MLLLGPPLTHSPISTSKCAPLGLIWLFSYSDFSEFAVAWSTCVYFRDWDGKTPVWFMHPSPKFSSVTQLCPTLCNLMDSSMPGFSVHHQLPKLAKTHVLWVGDAIQPSHLLSSPSPPAFNLSQHQGLFQWVSSLHQVAQSIGVSAWASVLSMNIQDWFPLRLTGWISLQSKGLSRVFSKT